MHTSAAVKAILYGIHPEPEPSTDSDCQEMKLLPKVLCVETAGSGAALGSRGHTVA